MNRRLLGYFLKKYLLENEGGKLLQNKKRRLLALASLLLVVNVSSQNFTPFVEAAEIKIHNEVAQMLPRQDGVQRIHANHLSWTPVSKENLLGGADDFNALLFDCFINFNETGGPVATKRAENIKTITFKEGTSPAVNQFLDYKLPRFNVALLSSQGIGGQVRIENGDVITEEALLGNQIQRTLDSGTELIRLQAIQKFLEEAKEDLQYLNEQIWTFPTTGEMINEWGTIQIETLNDTNIFELDLTEWTKPFSLSITDTNPNSLIIIRVKGDRLKLNSTLLNNQLINYSNINKIANRILWVFESDKKEFVFDSTSLIGSVLAPSTNLKFSGYSAVNGTVIANRLDGQNTSSELHYVGNFTGKLPTIPNEPVFPELPDDSEVPSRPQAPSEPESSTPPELPGDSETPSTPEVPDEPATPTPPELPGDSENSNTPEVSVKPENPNNSNKPIDVGGDSSNETLDSTLSQSLNSNHNKIEKLPQAGDKDVQLSKIGSIIGLGLLLFVGLFVVRRRKPKKLT